MSKNIKTDLLVFFSFNFITYFKLKLISFLESTHTHFQTLYKPFLFNNIPKIDHAFKIMG